MKKVLKTQLDVHHHHIYRAVQSTVSSVSCIETRRLQRTKL